MGDRRRHFLRLTGVAAVMFVFGFVVMPPLYSALCELTGFNGRTSNMVLPSEVTENPQDRTVTVELLTTVNGAHGLEWTVPSPAPYHTFEEAPPDLDEREVTSVHDEFDALDHHKLS